MRSSRFHLLRAAGAALVASAASAGPAAAAGKIEKRRLTVGTAVDSPTQLPLYIAAARTFAEQGLDVTFVSFRGDTGVAQALAGGSIDISLASSSGLVDLVSAGQPVIGFYAGFDQADFSWLAVPSVTSWADLKGKTIGVSSYGSLTDLITRYVLQKHRLAPERDVQIVQAGGSPSAVGALRAGRLAAAILSAPFKWELQDAGFTLLGTQAGEVSPQWPKHLFMAKTAFIDANPNTLVAVLRAHVAALRLAKANRAFAVDTLVTRLKYAPRYAQRAYAEEMPGFDERGRLPEAAMPIFWQLTVAQGTVKAPLPEAKLLDRRYVDSFARWAPKA